MHFKEYVEVPGVQLNGDNIDRMVSMELSKYKCFNCYAKIENAKYIFRGCPFCKEHGYVWDNDLENNLLNTVYEIFMNTDCTFQYNNRIRGLILDLLPEYPKERNRLNVIIQNGLLERMASTDYDPLQYRRKTGFLLKELRDSWGIEGTDIEIIIHSSYVCGMCGKEKKEYRRVVKRLNDIMYKYNPKEGSKEIFYNYEMKFNSDNVIFVYNK